MFGAMAAIWAGVKIMEWADSFDDDEDYCDEWDDDGQPDEYTEWQDYMGGDDWDHGQFDGDF